MYVFDNAAPQAPSRLSALAAQFDGATKSFLNERGLRAGAVCLEVGGGAGSIATWLAQRVGPEGSVQVTDIDPRHIDGAGTPNLTIVRHDIVNDPLPSQTFDLAHVRLVLSHLTAPGTAIARIFDALKPGGSLVAEDFEVIDSSALDRELSPTAKAMRAITGTASDQRLGRSLARRLIDAGFQQVDGEGRTHLVRGRSAGSRLLRDNFEQLRLRMLADGLSPEQFDRDVAALDDPSFEFRMPTMWTVWGRRPM